MYVTLKWIIIASHVDERRSIITLNANLTKWSNTLKQFVDSEATNCLRVFDHFVGLAFKRLNSITHHTSLTKSAQWVSLIFFRGNLDIGWSQMRYACIWFSFHCSRFLRRTYLQSSETLTRLKRLIKMKAEFIWVLSWFLDWGILCLIFEIAWEKKYFWPKTDPF